LPGNSAPQVREPPPRLCSKTAPENTLATMNNSVSTLVACFALLASPVVLAQSNDPCQTLSSTIENNACAKQKFEAQDSILNSAYNRLLSELPAENSPGVGGNSPRKLLIVAQRKWVAFRDADCSAQEKVFQNGSVRTVTYLDCLREHTEQRIKELDPTRWQGG
jgi:uncharacterized protein YecT (DUF1311 family)